ALVALHGLLHLVHHVLRAAAQRFKRPALLAGGAFAVILAKRALGLAHGFASLAETFAGLDAQAFEPLHQFLEIALQLALPLLEPAHGLGEFLWRHALALALALLALLTLLALLSLLTLLPLLSLLAGLALTALHLVEAERLVHGLLLAAHDVAEPVHLLAHFGLLTAALLLLLAAGLQIVHHVLELRKQFLGLLSGPGLRQILDLVEHALDVALGHHLTVLRHLLGEFAILHGAFGEL